MHTHGTLLLSKGMIDHGSAAVMKMTAFALNLCTISFLAQFLKTVGQEVDKHDTTGTA